jgi:aspartate carbamoyltransferase catalytic subunit
MIMLWAMTKSLLDFQYLNQDSILKIIDQSLKNKSDHLQNRQKYLTEKFNEAVHGAACLLFFEPSTRTRFSFEMACARIGVHPLVMDNLAGSSLEKGESIEDTILNLEAMGPLFFVVRCSEDTNLKLITEGLHTPMINAGWGRQGHPTQALLDVTTLIEKWVSIDRKNILFIGDVRHSRVFSSHLQLSKIMGYNLAYCSPPEFDLSASIENENVLKFNEIEEALKWADGVITLRVQKERHRDGTHVIKGLDSEQYRRQFGLNSDRAKLLKPHGVILHPGPINYGIEIEKNVLKDSRSVILQLVENGVFIREVILKRAILGD